MGAHSTAEKPSQTQCSVWLWSGEEEAGRAPACGTSHGPCQPRSTGVGGLGQEAQSKTTCCQPRCTTASESTCEVHKECTVHSVCAMQYTVYVLCSTQCMCYAVHSVCTMQYTVCVLCSTQCMYNAVHSVRMYYAQTMLHRGNMHYTCTCTSCIVGSSRSVTEP